MNAVQFTKLLEKPSPISELETADLGKLVKQFPYFQSAHLLYLKGLHQNKSIEYPKALKVTAAYANDRKKLYELIMKEDLHEQIRLVEEYSHTDEVTTKTNVSPLEAQILQEAVSASIKLEVAAQPESIEEEEEEEESVLGAPVVVTPPTPVESEETKSAGPNQTQTFSQWLREAEGTSPKAPVERSDIGRSEEVESTDVPDDNFGLIDKFIGAEPRISNAKTYAAESGREPFFSPVDTARLSLVDDPSFVTETLAGIYQAQGYLEKAKNAYTLLSLTYPEKRSIFAARIKELDKALKQGK